MVTERTQLYIYYQGKKILDKLNELDVVLAFISKKFHYVVFYCDKNKEKEIRRIVQKVKGFKFIGNSLLFNEEYNF